MTLEDKDKTLILTEFWFQGEPPRSLIAARSYICVFVT